MAESGRFKQLGFFLPDEVAEILSACNSELLLKSNLQQEYKLLDIMSFPK